MTSAKDTFKPLDYNELRILWNEGGNLQLQGTNTQASFYKEYGERRACVKGTMLQHDEVHDTFNSFWLVWGDWQFYRLRDKDYE